jgi:hypothetical protein
MCQLTGIKSSRRSLQHFKRERGHDIGLPGDDAGPFDGLCADGGDQLSPVDHCQTLLGTELDWGQVVTLQNLRNNFKHFFKKVENQHSQREWGSRDQVLGDQNRRSKLLLCKIDQEIEKALWVLRVHYFRLFSPT